MDFLKHPGNLGSVRSLFLAVHHYDWPAYPEGEDFRETLFHFTGFPHGTNFVEVDDGDHSILFVADVSCGRLEKPYHHRNFHVCAWHEDLIEMHNRGFITGIEPVTENAHSCGRWNNILRENNTDKLFINIDGEMREVPGPTREPDNEDEPRNWILLQDKHVSVTTTGFDFIVNEIIAADIDFTASLSPVVSKLMNDGLYDTAVREACVTLEHAIKGKLESNKWGERLTDEFLEYLRDKEKVLESEIRTYSQELRTVFKLVRNVFMHNLNLIDREMAIILLFRISRVKTALES
ncbi:MAG: hypothetical protein GY845_23770 [Planctomycetes bacterium]|nr:hypothetical protein [Planctomycetota bacterium]